MKKAQHDGINFERLAILGAAIIFILWFTLPVILFNMYNDQKIPQELGIIGDMFGSVNALFAGVGLLLVVLTLRQGHNSLKVQQEELRVQHEELIESRKVLSEQAAAQKEMTIALRRLANETRYSSQVNAQCAILHSTDEAGGKRSERQKLTHMMVQPRS